MVVSSPTGFADAVIAHRLDDVAVEGSVVEMASTSLRRAGMLAVGAPHGVRETPSVLYALASLLDVRAVAFEWSHEEMDAPLQAFARSGEFDFEQLWSRPPSAEWDERVPLLVLTGAFHAQLEAAEGGTMAMHLARRRPGLLTAMIDYRSGQCWSRGQLHEISRPVPEASITLRVPEATPAVVPGHPAP